MRGQSGAPRTPWLAVRFFQKGELPMELSLQRDEAELLQSVLRIYLSDLRMEICGTDDYLVREALKKDEEMVKRLIARREWAALNPV